jgi:hypothetical protein
VGAERRADTEQGTTAVAIESVELDDLGGASETGRVAPGFVPTRQPHVAVLEAPYVLFRAERGRRACTRTAPLGEVSRARLDLCHRRNWRCMRAL